MIETDIIQGDIRFRESDHSYIHVPTKKRLTPVSDVIRTVYATKSWDGVDPAVVDNARVRGVAVDGFMALYVRDQKVTVEGATEDVKNRVIIAHRIWEEQFHGLSAESQKIVYNLDDGVAGTMDFLVDHRIVVDLKSTYSRELGWALQVGAYVDYSGADQAGIIHISPKTYKDGGRWIEYDPKVCRMYWRKAVEWWEETKHFAKAIKI